MSSQVNVPVYTFSPLTVTVSSTCMPGEAVAVAALVTEGGGGTSAVSVTTPAATSYAALSVVAARSSAYE
jgi:hypothetical protein